MRRRTKRCTVRYFKPIGQLCGVATGQSLVSSISQSLFAGSIAGDVLLFEETRETAQTTLFYYFNFRIGFDGKLNQATCSETKSTYNSPSSTFAFSISIENEWDELGSKLSLRNKAL